MLVRDVWQEISDPHVYTCPGCSGQMEQDFGNARLTIMGDLPTIGVYNGYYDPNLGEEITSSRQRSELMKKKGLEPFSMDDDQARMHKEVEYTMKHAPKKEAGRAINKMAADTLRKKDERFIATTIDPVIDKAVGSLSD